MIRGHTSCKHKDSRSKVAMNDKVEKDSEDEELIVQEADDEDYEEVTEQGDAEDKSASQKALLSGEEDEVIRVLEGVGFELRTFDESYLAFRRTNLKYPEPPYSGRYWRIPRAYAKELLAQIGEEIDELPSVVGLTIPARGYVELWLASRVVTSMIARRLFSLRSDDLDCIHIDPDRALPSLPFRSFGEEGEAARRVHLSGKGSDPCIEMSNASPLAMLFFGRGFYSGSARASATHIPFILTLKIDYGVPVPKDQLIKKGEEIARSFLYELDVRNGLGLDLRVRMPRREADIEWRITTRSNRIRYPRSRLQLEVSSLFSFASQAVGDPPLAFLSYYQTLEYFIPAAVRQSALKAIKRELRDPGFDEADNDSLLRIVTAAEGSISAAESSQFRILVSDYVRTNRLEEFFDHDWGNYFTRQGPIKGVDPINPKNPNQSLSNQIADRIYQIRNRIVHAKDDPKFGDARVLLPRSAESNAMQPDVLLVRLLATEAIAASQAM
jgi:hypothetical protein